MTLHEQIDAVVHRFVAGRLAAAGQQASPDLDLFEAGVLDSVALVELITAVEQATSLELDFIEVDPDELSTHPRLVAELARVLELELE